ncbi:hypothetical protein GCK72_005131 [Caenorhabditis remanei]|uniref:Uncharacterized protein n=1 Tax=Caenorhabditis remanei TaxID=31234 RepID=A0A6A5HDR3_CAERE|nr:hypothetical protein GCK72_005131 [Caenorhabditis remanei]KAF1765179.1 hypothetical protein GCK72_005131 [Caenorhabditis remanei]
MKYLLLVTVIVMAFVPLSQSVSDRQCGNDTNFIWLDIVLVIDNSPTMISDNVYESISSIFGPNSQIGTGYTDPRSSRVAIVTYNNYATTVADFRTIKSLKQLKTQLTALDQAGNSGNQSYLDQGLISAQSILTKFDDRENYKKVVLIFTSSFDFIDSRPDRLAETMKSNGVTVITVNTGKDKTVEKQLEGVASAGFAFKMSTNTTETLQNALTTSMSIVQLFSIISSDNCHCLDYWTWTQYKHFGVCMLNPGVKGTHQAAHKYCRGLGIPGNLATEFNEEKRKFNYKFLNNNIDGTTVSSYYNGLTSENGTWYWDQPKGKPMIPLDPSSGSISTTSGCVADIKYSDGSISWTPISCSNSFNFLCEAVACDTDNYCDSS